MQDDDNANPGFLWVQQGAGLWDAAAGSTGKSCADCHGGDRHSEDPTEAIASSEILPATERRFQLLERRDYGGNLLAILYPNLRKPPDFDRWIATLIEWDSEEMRRRPSFSTVVIASPR